MRTSIATLALLAAACSRPAPAAEPPPPDKPANGLIVATSENSFADTLTRLTSAIESRGLRVFTTVDHSANASGAGLELEPTAVVIFGNPKVGTQLMQRGRTAAIDLPQKFLVWQDGSTVRVAYNDPAYLGERHGLGEMPVLDKISGLLGGLQKAATGP